MHCGGEESGRVDDGEAGVLQGDTCVFYDGEEEGGGGESRGVRGEGGGNYCVCLYCFYLGI